LPELPVLPRLPEFENQQQGESVLDQPWRVTMLPDGEVPTMALPSPDAERPRKSLPWKTGDVTRLRDDSPEGMMRYIATHTTGWWQEMAERALRDTEKARRMAEEAGWQPGQYWSLQVDAEAREKLRAQEEARRQREQQESAREQAEKEAFAKRQMELLKKAGKASRCEYLYTDGRGCRAPQVRGERWCHGHAKMMSYRPEKLELLPMEDEQAVTVNLYRVTKSLLCGRVTEKVAGLMLWSVAIAAPYVKRKTKTHHGGTEARRKATHQSTRKSKTHSGVPPQPANCGLPPHKAKSAHCWDPGLSGDPGVTRRKSFRSGVERGGRVLPERPAMPKIAKNENSNSSVSPCLHGENSSSASPRLHGETNALKSTELHSHAQATSRDGHL
jgi:hypothetical protein